MKKLILGISLFCGLSSFSKDASAQTFAIALEQYEAETGTTTFEGQEIQPSWFRHKTKEVDTNGDGVNDATLSWNEFWIFGRRIWSCPVTSNPV